MYGQLPLDLGTFELTSVPEMMFVQYLPIKMRDNGLVDMRVPKNLDPFSLVIGAAACAFVGEYGLDKFVDSYIYISAKRMWQDKGNQFNRGGWHCDGFMTDDINYVWSDSAPTVFNRTKLDLTQDDTISMRELEVKTLRQLDMIYPDKSLLRLNQYVIHRVNPSPEAGMRSFIKISFSKDKYDLEGNAHNHLFKYDWKMKPRNIERNIPQGALK